jgi:rSAM/selenodomain-associated transferase 1
MRAKGGPTTATTLAPAVIVIAKEPVAGTVKTRLCPPCSPEQATALAQAAVADTLDAVASTEVARTFLVLDGKPWASIPRQIKVLPQRGAGLGERLAAAFADVGGPALLIGMDTPQVRPAMLRQGLLALAGDDVDAVLGLSSDGGYWAIGLRHSCAEVFRGVPMSQPHTGAIQRRRFQELGLTTERLPVLRDVDTIEDAETVARLIPASRFAQALDAIGVYA